jgi:hypothetical protein
MKKTLLVLSLAFFLGTAFVTVTKVQDVHAASTELAFIVDDASAITLMNDDEPTKVAKDAKSAKCASASSCDKTKCASKTATADKGTCCDSKGKSTAQVAGKSECCSKEKAIKDSDKK